MPTAAKISAMTAGAAFLLAAAAVWLGWTDGADDAVHSFALAQRTPGRTTTMVAVSAVFAPYVATVLTIAISFVVAVWTWSWRRPLIFAVGVLCSAFAFRLAKELLRHGRPAAADWIEYAGGWSFPSGHTTIAAALCLGAVAVFGSAWPAWARRAAWAAAAVVALAVGISRVYLGVHWLGDVVGGAALGVAASAVMGGITALCAPQESTPGRTV